MSPVAFAPASPGDFLWCWFPHDRRLVPAPKPRPALALAVGVHEDDPGQSMIRIAAGTSRKVELHQILAWEFLLHPDDGIAYTDSGLSYPTKFNLRNTLELPLTKTYFGPPPHRPFGDSPKMGVLHPSLIKRLKAVYALC